MPLTDEQKAAVVTLATAEPDEVSVELKSKAHPIYELVFNNGFKAAAKQKGKEERELEQKITEKDTEIARLGKRIEELEKTAPTSEKLKKDYDDEILRLKAEHKKALDDSAALADDREVSRVIDRLEAIATDPKIGSIRKAWAKNLLRDPDLRKRIKPAKGDHPTEILQKGKEIPIQADGLDKQLEVLAKELHEQVKKEDPDGIAMKVDDGAEIQGGDARATGDGYDPVKAGKEMAAAQKVTTDRTKNVAFR